MTIAQILAKVCGLKAIDQEEPARFKNPVEACKVWKDKILGYEETFEEINSETENVRVFFEDGSQLFIDYPLRKTAILTVFTS